MRAVWTSLLAIALVAAMSAPALAGDAMGVGRDRVVFGLPRVASVSMTDIVVDVPVRLQPVGVDGTIERVVFSNMELNGIPFDVADYDAPFELPANESADLPQPLRLHANFATVAPGLFGEAIMPSDTLHLTGRVIVSGTFRKWVFSFHRTADMRIDESGPNPLADYAPLREVLARLRQLEQLGVRLPF